MTKFWKGENGSVVSTSVYNSLGKIELTNRFHASDWSWNVEYVECREGRCVGVIIYSSSLDCCHQTRIYRALSKDWTHDQRFVAPENLAVTRQRVPNVYDRVIIYLYIFMHIQYFRI